MDQLKKCTKCGTEKALSEFSKDKRSKDGYYRNCKSCNKAYRETNKDKIKAYREANKEKRKAYREANKDKLKEYSKAYRETNKDKIKERQKKCYDANKEKRKAYREANKHNISELNKKWREANKDKIKAYRDANKDKEKELSKKWREANKDNIKEYSKAYYESNKDNIKEYKKANRDKINEYQKKRLKKDSLFKLRRNLSTRLWSAIKNKGYSKNTKTADTLGCSWEFLKDYLEAQFIDGMNWDNYGEWHIDHIKPLASAETEQDVYDLNHYTNLQPLWAEDNLSKSDNIDYKQFRLL